MDYLAHSLNPKYLSKIVTDSGNVPATDEAAQLSPGWQTGGKKRFFLDESAAFAELRPPTPGYPFLTTTFAKAAQDIIARHYYRPTDKSAAAKHAHLFPALKLFTIDEVFGGWSKAQPLHFGDGGVFDQIYQPGT